MATLALPIRELQSARDEAERVQSYTKCAARYAKARTDDFHTVWKLAKVTFALKRRLASLATKQGMLIETLVQRDFTGWSSDELTDFANRIDELVTDERDALAVSYDQLGSDIRFWWGTSLRTLAEQVEHLDSIAESLHVAADPKCIALLALAAEQAV